MKGAPDSVANASWTREVSAASLFGRLTLVNS